MFKPPQFFFTVPLSKSLKRISTAGLVALSVILGTQTSKADNWPGWRGPTGSGISTEINLPLKWDSKKNIRWKVNLPGPGNSTPIVWENKVFLNQATKAGDRQLHCYNRLTGESIWKKSVRVEEQEPTFRRNNPYCTASPVTDGKRVVNFYGSPGIYCYDLNGKKIWHRKFGKLDHMYGQGSSPIIYKDLCVMVYGPSTEEFVIALNLKTGETVWKMEIPKPEIPPDVKKLIRQFNERSRKLAAKKNKAKIETKGKRKAKRRKLQLLGTSRATNPGGVWATPLVIHVHGRDELILSFPEIVAAYNPLNGEQLWRCRGNYFQVKPTPCYGEGFLAVTGGSEMAIRPGGAGDITEKNRLWYRQNGKDRTGSAVIYQGYLYTNDSQGIMYCYELKTGKAIWRKRLTNEGRSQGSWSSVMLGDGKIYAINKSGDVFVMKAAPKFELLATNSFGKGETTNASIIAAHGDLFVRTDKALWCVRSQK